MGAIIKKELKSYFYSPIGYVVVGLSLAIFSMIFYNLTIQQGAVRFQDVYFYTVIYISLFMNPLLTMRMFAEERKNGTEQLLITSPRSMFEITMGKFFSAVIVVLLIELLTLIYLGIICFFKTPDMAIVMMTMLGFLLLSMAYISLGMFISSLTENQIIAAISTIAIFIVTWIAPYVYSSLKPISLIMKFDIFTTGVFPITEIISFLSITVMFLLLTMIVMKRRKLVK